MRGFSDGTPLRAATGDPVPVLGPPTGTLLDPATFSPAKLGNSAQNIVPYLPLSELTPRRPAPTTGQQQSGGTR